MSASSAGLIGTGLGMRLDAGTMGTGGHVTLDLFLTTGTVFNAFLKFESMDERFPPSGG